MLYEVAALLCGGVLGFAVTYKIIERGTKEETGRIVEVARTKVTVGEKRREYEVDKLPTSLDELADYISKKYMLSEVTLLTSDGLPVVSNSVDPERDAATAPEILKTVRRLLESDSAVLSSGGNRILVMKINPDVILHARLTRDISRKEMESMREEVDAILEGLI